MGEDIAKLIHEGPKEALAMTTNTQPVMLVSAVAAYRAWLAEGDAADGLDIGYLVDTREVRPGQVRVQVLSAQQQGRAATRSRADGSRERLHDRVPLLLRWPARLWRRG